MTFGGVLYHTISFATVGLHTGNGKSE